MNRRSIRSKIHECNGVVFVWVAIEQSDVYNHANEAGFREIFQKII